MNIETLDDLEKAIAEEWHCILGDHLKAKLLECVKRARNAEAKLAEAEEQEPIAKAIYAASGFCHLFAYNGQPDYKTMHIDSHRYGRPVTNFYAEPKPSQDHLPVDKKLDKHARVGGRLFGAGVSERLVIEAAQRQYEEYPAKEIPADALCFHNTGEDSSKHYTSGGEQS